MTLFVVKPVVWNTLGYTRPSGARFTSGYPKENGFGHEEWNNSERYSYHEGKERRRIFHTEQVDHPLLIEGRSRAMVFMIASHGGKQYIVAVAGQADYLRNNRAERDRLSKLLGLSADRRWEEAWTLPQVSSAWNGDLKAFRAEWRRDQHWTPSWSCPEASYFVPKTPVEVDARKLTGKRRFGSMYSSYQPIDQSIARKMLLLLPDTDHPIVRRLVMLAGGGDQNVKVDLSDIEMSNLAPTTRLALIEARVGQGNFRSDVVSAWGGRCSVTGCAVDAALQACHVKPWKSCTNAERLSAENALLLTANLHRLFDAGLIWFEADGRMGVAASISPEDRRTLGIGGALRRPPTGKLAAFLAAHREAHVL